HQAIVVAKIPLQPLVFVVFLLAAELSPPPCSRTTTEKPAGDNCFAIMPPAAPEPMITKSTSADGRYCFIFFLPGSPKFSDIPRHSSQTAPCDSETRHSRSTASLLCRGCRHPRAARRIRY